MPVLQGVSRDSLRAARDRLADLAAAATAQQLETLADELFAVVGVLDRSGALRRALTDPARRADDRAGLAEAVFGSRLSPPTVAMVLGAVRDRWSAPRDLPDALEALAAEALVVSAEWAGRLDEVEDELFRFARIVAAQPELRGALVDRALPAERKTGLVDALLAERAAPETRRLVRQAALAPRGRTVERLLEEFGEAAAARRNRLVAHVTAAVELSAQQRDRLAAALRRIYGHDMHLDVAVNPDLIGGLQVLVGDEVVDGSLVSRLDDARRRLVG